MGQLSATMEQTRETQLAQLYDVLGFRRVIARYDVLSTRHETGPSLFNGNFIYSYCTLCVFCCILKCIDIEFFLNIERM